MKTLFITRHAEADKKPHSDASDLERPLTEAGKKAAKGMARRLYQMNVMPELVISSPARRAWSTSGSMVSEWGLDPERIESADWLYKGNAEELMLRVSEFPNDRDRIMVVGHQPEIARSIKLLTTYEATRVPPCTTACCEIATDDWNAVIRGSGHLKWMMTPERIE